MRAVVPLHGHHHQAPVVPLGQGPELMGELFGIVIVVAVLIGVFCAGGPKAMLATIFAGGEIAT